MTFLSTMSLILIADITNGNQSTWAKAWEFLAVGGFFMLLLGITSVAAVTVIVYKALMLRPHLLVPHQLCAKLAKLNDVDSAVPRLEEEIESGESTLARVCRIALHTSDRPREEAVESVEAAARAEVVRLHSGTTALEIIITVAPLLGLLGTASGLVIMFEELGATSDHMGIARGIGRALNTTIVGLAITIPAVVANGYFNRRIERAASRLETVVGEFVAWCSAQRRSQSGNKS